jgi:hypothetical protein
VILIPVPASGPSWADILTAVGTVGAVLAAVGIALWTEFRSGRRLAAEQARSDRQLEEERARSRAEIEEERRIARERAQLAEAYKVEVAMAQRDAGVLNDHDEADDSVQQLAAMVVNRGAYTITRIEAQFSYDGMSLVPHHGVVRQPGPLSSPERLRGSFHLSPERAMSGVLTPWGGGIRFEGDKVHVKFLSNPYPLVRWTDRWGARWEHRRGEVRQVRDDEAWMP